MRLRDVGTFLSFLQLVLSLPEFGEVNVGLFILKPKRPAGKLSRPFPKAPRGN